MNLEQEQGAHKPSNNRYITTPIYYVNAKPHLGTLYTTLLADVFKRWYQIQGDQTFLLTGTDEHGQKVAEAAEKAGMSPQAFVDQLVPAFSSAWDHYHIGYDHFIRTTDPAHMRAVQGWLQRLIDSGDVYKDTYVGWYDQSQEAFLTEKDMEFRSGEEVPYSLLSGKQAIKVSEESYFFRLSKYQERLLAWYQSHPDFVVPHERLQEVISFVSSGLKDLSISRRTLTWGVPFPGDEHHVTYVWADALLNYVTGVGYDETGCSATCQQWWPADIQLMAKDILRFHAVYWPAFLMASGLPLPKTLLVHGWIKVDGQKMSKSIGNVVDPVQLAEAYGVDAVRYYLTRYLPITQDATFSTGDLETRVTTDLVNDLSNLVHRTLVLAQKQSLTKLSGPYAWTEAEQQLKVDIQQSIGAACKEMERLYLHQAYAEVWRAVARVNSYMHEQAPWQVLKTDEARFATIIAAVCHSLALIGAVVWPVMPASMERLFGALGVPFVPGRDMRSWICNGAWDLSFVLTPTAPLFTRLNQTKEQTMEEKKEAVPTTADATANQISIDEFVKVEIHTGTIVSVSDIPNSEKIYQMQVDLGALGIRTICAGVKKHYSVDELTGRRAIFVTNLQPRKLLGVMSHGMMLMATDADGVPTIVAPADGVPNGTRLK